MALAAFLGKNEDPEENWPSPGWLCSSDGSMTLTEDGEVDADEADVEETGQMLVSLCSSTLLVAAESWEKMSWHN